MRRAPARRGAASGGAAAPKPGDCDWHTLPKLEAVREVERKIAERHGFAFWNWASIMPQECGAHRWATASPPPVYNFATDPVVSSRRPLWDLKHPEDPDWKYD